MPPRSVHRRAVMLSMNAKSLSHAVPAGMHYALQLAAPHACVVQAFEISDLANDVYEHNHGWRPWQGNIEAVRATPADSCLPPAPLSTASRGQASTGAWQSHRFP